MTLHEQTRAHAQEGTKIPSVLQVDKGFLQRVP